MRGLGAEVSFHGADFDSAREWVMGIAAAQGGRFVAPRGAVDTWRGNLRA